MKTINCIEWTVTGLHQYPGSKRPDIAREHPHIFGIKVEYPELFSREIEWLDFRDQVRTLFSTRWSKDGTYEFGSLSCESISIQVAMCVACFMKDRPIRVTVSELDKTCSTTTTFTTKELGVYYEQQLHNNIKYNNEATKC